MKWVRPDSLDQLSNYRVSPKKCNPRKTLSNGQNERKTLKNLTTKSWIVSNLSMKISFQNSSLNFHDNGFPFNLVFCPKSATCAMPQQNKTLNLRKNALKQSTFNETSWKSVNVQLNTFKYDFVIFSLKKTYQTAKTTNLAQSLCPRCLSTHMEQTATYCARFWVLAVLIFLPL